MIRTVAGSPSGTLVLDDRLLRCASHVSQAYEAYQAYLHLATRGRNIIWKPVCLKENLKEKKQTPDHAEESTSSYSTRRLLLHNYNYSYIVMWLQYMWYFLHDSFPNCILFDPAALELFVVAFSIS